MAQEKFVNSSLKDQLLALRRRQLAQETHQLKHGPRSYSLSAPAIGRLLLHGEQSLADVYGFIESHATLTVQPPTPFMTMVFYDGCLRYGPRDAHTLLGTLPQHPFYDSKYADAPIECEVMGATVRSNRYRGQPGSSLGIRVQEMPDAHYRLQDERDMLFDHMDGSTPPYSVFKAYVGFIRDCALSDVSHNMPLPDTLTFGPLQLVPSLASEEV